MRSHRFPHASEDSDAICVGPIVTISITMSSGSLTKSKILTQYSSTEIKEKDVYFSYDLFFFLVENYLTHIINVAS